MGESVGGVLVVGSGGVRQATPTEAMGVDATALAARVAAVETRLAVLEARPEEVAHFTALARVPALAVAAATTLRLTALVPARKGDVLKAGTAVAVAARLPAGLNIAAATVPEDGLVEVQLTATLAVAASATPLAWAISALL